VPKYLNSPETPIYTKGRTLYGLDATKADIRKASYCVLVEGYFDFAAVWQAGVHPVVASCGTALTPAQARMLKRFASKVVLSFDPDAAGQGAAAKSSSLLVTEGFQVNVALLPEGTDPDTLIRRAGAKGYVDRLKSSRPYLEFLLDRAAAKHDLSRDHSRRTFLNEMLGVAATIPDAATRDQFADRLAHKARITEGVIRDEIRKAAAARKTEAPAVAVQTMARLRPAETGLLWALAHRPVEGIAALSQLEMSDTEGLLSQPVLAMATSLADVPADVLPEMLRERLSEGERQLLERAARLEASPAPPVECVAALKRLRYERERARVQDEIEALDRAGADPKALQTLWAEKTRLSRLLEET
jgi:DNA primase